MVNNNPSMRAGSEKLIVSPRSKQDAAVPPWSVRAVGMEANTDARDAAIARDLLHQAPPILVADCVHARRRVQSRMLEAAGFRTLLPLVSSLRQPVRLQEEIQQTLLVMSKETPMPAKLMAEFIGTFWLVLGGCGSAVLAAAFPEVGIGFLGVALAFGLTVLTGAYALGPISGGHFNPAVSVGLWAGGRFPAGQLLPYIVVQVLGGILGAGVLYLIASGKADFSLAGGLASNGYGEHSPGKYSMTSGLVTEVVMTFMFLLVILGATHQRAPVGFAGLAIGLALTLIHLISIPVTNTSVNPARSTGPAIFVGGWALQQLWLFWIAPIIGAAIAGFTYKTFLEGEWLKPPLTGRTESGTVGP
jgi:aquaporin Z